jgi:glycosyltransferase involved in cell wall biosynthesis
MDTLAENGTISDRTPCVSIGLPVFNGEKYLRKSIESILEQTFQDFELIISDNGSTDETESICREYAARSDKIRFYRQNENMGAAANFEFVFQKSRGKYFKWQGHDDYAYPEFLEKCVARLEADPQAVLCQSHVALIDSNDVQIGVYAHEDFNTNDPDPIERFAGRLRNNRCAEIHGLLPRRVLANTERLGPFVSHDRCLLSHLSLMGRFLDIPEVLFAFRIHPQQFTRDVMGRADAMNWLDPKLAAWPTMPRWTHLCRCIRHLNTVELSGWDRLRGYGVLIRSQFQFRHMRGLFRESRRLAKYGARRALGRSFVLSKN